MREALEKAIDDMVWMFGGWGNLTEDDYAVARPVAHANIEAARAALGKGQG